MGMDLYKYTINKNGDDTLFIGTNLLDSELEAFRGFDIFSVAETDMVKAFEDIHNAFGTTEEPECWDCSESSNVQWALYLNEEYKIILSEFHTLYNDANTSEEREKVSNEEDAFFNMIYAHAKNYEQFPKGVVIDDKFGKLYILPNLALENKFYIKGDRDESFYYRKPFRHNSTPSNSQNGTLTLYVDNFTGSNEDNLDKLYKKVGYKEEDYCITFTNKHEVEEEFLSCLPEDTRDSFKGVFPLKNNEVIHINW